MPAKGLNYSAKVKSLFKKIFVTNSANRITAKQILKDNWLYKKPKMLLTSAIKEKTDDSIDDLPIEVSIQVKKEEERMSVDEDILSDVDIEGPGPGKYAPTSGVIN